MFLENNEFVLEQNKVIESLCIKLVSGQFFSSFNANTSKEYNIITTASNKEVIEERLFNIGYELVIDYDKSTVYAIPKDDFTSIVSKRNLTKDESITLLILIHIYLTETFKLQSNMVTITSVERLYKEIEKLFDKTPGEKKRLIINVNNALYLFKTYNIIDLSDYKTNLSSETIITIYPSILSVYNSKNDEEILDKLNAYTNKKEDMEDDDE